MKRINLNHEELIELQSKVKNMNPVDLADYIVSLDYKEQVLCIKLLEKEHLAHTFSELPRKNKEKLIESLTEDEIKEMFEELESDELVDTIQELPANMVNKLLNHVSDKKRPLVNKLLGYPKESVGSIMSVDFLMAKEHSLKEEILQKVYQTNIDATNLEVIWIVDKTLKLKGFIYLADLLRLKENNVEEILNPISSCVTTLDDQEVAAKLINRYHLEALPVVDLEGRLVGSIVTETILDVIVDEFEEDILNLQGINKSNEEHESYLDMSVFKISKKRLSWLVILMFTATVTSILIQRYEAVLASSVALVAYIPVLMDTGGNSGSQSTATVIQSLARDEIGIKDFFRVLFKEIRIGLVVGLVMGMLNFVRIMIMDRVGMDVAFVVSFTLLVTLVVSKSIGGILPLIAIKFKQDPTVMAGPLITTVVDATALIVYFEIAKLFLNI